MATIAPLKLSSGRDHGSKLNSLLLMTNLATLALVAWASLHTNVLVRDKLSGAGLACHEGNALPLPAKLSNGEAVNEGTLVQSAAVARVQGAPLADGNVCFTTKDYGVMFTARVAKPHVYFQGVLNALQPQPHYATLKELMALLHHTGDSIYTDFKLPAELPDVVYPHSHVNGDTVAALKSLHPEPMKFMVEVGSFVGGSAIHWGNMLKAQEQKGVLLCIDPWTGDLNMILGGDFVPFMARVNGNGRLYERFIGNIVAANLTDVVVPLRLPSVTGARLVFEMKFQVDVVYLDSAHEFGETFFELSMYWEILKPGGILFGDDYDWGSVKHDVDLFVKMHNIEPKFMAGSWWLVKPAK